MKVLVTCLTVALLISIPGYSQKWQKGAIAPDKKDTMLGFVHCMTQNIWSRTPVKLAFREHKHQTPINFSIEDVGYFKVGNKTFLRSYTEIKDHGDTLDYDDVWVQELVKGDSISLLEYKDHFYYSDDDAEMNIMLIHGEWEEHSRDGDTVFGRENIYYKLQLKAIAKHFGLEKELSGMIDSCPYEAFYLSNVILKLNKGKAQVLYPHERDMYTVSLFTGLGYGLSQANLNDNNLMVNSQRLYNKSMTYYSLGADLSSNILNLFARLDFSYSSLSNYSGENTTKQNYRQSFQFNQSGISIGISVLDQFYRRPNFVAYGGLGISQNLAFFKRVILFESGNYYDADNYLNLRKGWINMTLRAGAILKSIWEAGFILTPPVKWSEIDQNSLLKNESICFYIAYHFKSFARPW